MVNSHYIPQFILRNFCNDNKITYCDLDKKTMEYRSVRSVFAEKGYYPDDLEKELSKRIEYDFSVLYHNKIENPRSTITLDSDELFLLKKYLIVSAIRYHYEYTAFELEYLDKLGDSYKPDYDNNIKRILDTDNIEDLQNIIYSVDGNYVPEKMLSGERLDDENINMPLWADVRDIVNSYVVFVRAPKDEKFIISDRGRGIYEGPMSRRKITGLIECNMKSPNLILSQVLLNINPHDYTVCPLTKDVAVLSMSVFFKFFTDSEIRTNVKLPDDCPTVSAMLGFGGSNDIAPPKVRFNKGKKEYRYTVNRLTSKDISFFNFLMMAQAQHHIAFSDVKDIPKSVEAIADNTFRDFSFLRNDIP